MTEDDRELHLQRLFRHFGMRLFERHGLTITYEEYRELCLQPILVKHKVKKSEGKHNTIILTMNIKVKDLVVYRGTKKLKALLTVI